MKLALLVAATIIVGSAGVWVWNDYIAKPGIVSQSEQSEPTGTVEASLRLQIVNLRNENESLRNKYNNLVKDYNAEVNSPNLNLNYTPPSYYNPRHCTTEYKQYLDQWDTDCY
jgi:hypothetical protein